MVKVPQAEPLHPVPETLQLTPWLFKSPVSVAVKFTVCPWSIVLVPLGASETVIGGAFTVIENWRCAESGVEAESVTFTVKVEVPEPVGVPEMAPALLKVKPAGSGPEPEAKLQASTPVPPVSVSVVL